MFEKVVSPIPVHLLRAGIAALLVLGLALVVGVMVARAQVVCGDDQVVIEDGTGNLVCADWDPSYEPECPAGKYYDHATGKCLTIVYVDCGPSPYRYNVIGGHWERRFHKWCYPTTKDPFEQLFHNMSYSEAQNELAQMGLGNLSREGQIAALAGQGYLTEGGSYTRVETEDKDEEEKIAPQDCGQNPYRFNDIGGHFERRFSAACQPFTGDPNETTYDGLFLYETPLGS